MPLVFRSATTSRFDWNPELEALEARLIMLEEYFEHTEEFMLDAKDEAQIDMARRFEEEVDPTGTPWAPLVMPATEQVGILRLTTEMSDKAINEAYVVSPAGLFFDTSELPPYWIHHEMGQRVPQRAFIGLSRVAQERLQDRFSGWVRGGIELGRRGFVRQLRAPAGTFRRAPR